MSVKLDPLNQDLNSTKNSYSPAHQHLEQNAPDAIVSNKSRQEKLDRLGMQSARRAGNRFADNADRLPEDTMFTK